MTVETQTPETQNARAETADQGSEDAAALAFSKGSTPESEDSPTEADPDHKSAEETAEEADEAEPEAESEAGELVEVEYEGKTYKVPPELQKGYLRQAEFSRKMNEVGDKEKVFTQRIETADKLVSSAEKLGEVKAELTLIDGEIKRFDKVDWQKLEREDASQASLLAVKLLRLQQARKDVAAKADGIESDVAKARSKLTETARDEMDAVLRKDVKGWGEKMGAEVSQYALANGFTRAQLASLSDPNVVKALLKASQFDALQQGKTALKAKAKDAPQVVKPGTARPREDKSSEAFGRLRKSGSIDDAADAFASRMR